MDLPRPKIRIIGLNDPHSHNEHWPLNDRRSLLSRQIDSQCQEKNNNFRFILGDFEITFPFQYVKKNAEQIKDRS